MSASTPPPPASSGHGKFIAVAVLLLLGIAFIVAWRFLDVPSSGPTARVDAASSATVAPIDTRVDDVPPPPPVEDAGPDSGTRFVGPAVRPCDVTACSGKISADTEASLAMLARQTRKKCYEPALTQDPSLKGHVDLRLKIGADGSICAANVESADPGMQQTGECTARLILAAGRVPAPLGCVNVKFPVNYKPMGQ